MAKLLLFLGLLISFSSYAQQTDYNIQDKAVAGGYDVVAYFSNNVSKGKKKYSTTYNNVTFRFSSEENLTAFLKSPEKYIPQYGGYCAYAIAAKKIKMETDPETYEIRDGKLYLFYNSWFSNKLEDWQEGNTKKLQQQGDENWKVLKYKKD